MGMISSFKFIVLCTLIYYVSGKEENLGTVIGIDLGTTYSWWVEICSIIYPDLNYLSQPYKIIMFMIITQLMFCRVICIVKYSLDTYLGNTSAVVCRSWILYFVYVFTFSVGVFKNGRVEIIANDQGNRITPSYVAFTADGERLIGDAAKNQLTTNPENTVFDAKRLIGRDWTDAAVQHDIKYFPFKVNNSIYV